MLRINFIRRNPLKKIEERIKSSQVKLKDSLMYFKDDKIFFSDIDRFNDYLEISFSLISNEKEKLLKSSTITIKDLILNKEKDDLWTLNSNSLINLKYHLFEDLVKDILSEFDFNSLILDRKKLKSGNKLTLDDSIKSFSINESMIEPSTPSFLKKEKSSLSLKRENYSTPITNPNVSQLQSKTNDKKHSFPSLNRNLGLIGYSVNGRKVSIPNGEESLLSLNISSNNIKNRGDSNSEFNLNILNLNRSKNILNNNFCGDIIDYEIVEYKKEFKKYDDPVETLCEGFFISGLKKDSKIIQDSMKFKSQCSHSDCSLLVSYKPEILMKFEKIINNVPQIEITNLFTSLCFPTGIKICYNSKNETMIPKKTFMNYITNQKGETYYLVNFFYYKLKTFETFKSEYSFDPVRDYLKIITDPINSYGKIEKELQICSNLINSNNFYIPECISLITKYPYVKQLEKCLESIFKTLYRDNLVTNDTKKYVPYKKISINPNEEIFSLLSHLIYEVPLPPINKKIMFYIPYNILEVPSIIMKDRVTVNYSLKILFDEFSIENIIMIFYLIILEQRILIVNEDHSKLSEITQAFLSIIFPLKWVNPYIPVLSEDFIQYLQSFIPFIMGIDNDLLTMAFKKKYILPDENSKIFIMNCDNATISILKDKKERKINSKNLHKEGLPELPEEINFLLKSELKAIQKLLNESKNKKKLNEERVDITIKEIFIKVMIMIFGDYQKYTYKNEDGEILFNQEVYLINRPAYNRKFYQEVCQTQIFKEFLHEDYYSRIANHSQVNNSREKNKYNLPFHNGYFYNMSIRYITLINSNNKTKGKRSSSVSHNDLFDNTQKTRSNSNTNIMRIDISNDLQRSSQTPNTNRNNSFYAESLCNTELNSSKSVSHNLTNENTASNTKDCVDSYLLSPYFVNDPISKFDQVKIEEIFNQKYCNENHSEILRNRIVENHTNSNYNYENYQEYFRNKLETLILRKYNLKSLHTAKKSFVLKNNFENFLYEFTNQICIPKESLPQVSQICETIKNIINCAVSNIFDQSNSKLQTNNLTSIKKYLALHQGRTYFSYKVYHYMSEEFTSLSNKYQLNDVNFNNLSKMINTFLVFSEEMISGILEVIIILKCTFYFHKLSSSNKIKYIYEDFEKKQCTILSSEKLWTKWFELEIDNSKDQNNLNSFNSCDDYYFVMLVKLSCVMMLLGIKQSKINSIILQSIAPNYIKKENTLIFKELEDSIEKQNKLLTSR